MTVNAMIVDKKSVNRAIAEMTVFKCGDCRHNA